jgi:hypothetical protein
MMVRKKTVFVRQINLLVRHPSAPIARKNQTGVLMTSSIEKKPHRPPRKTPDQKPLLSDPKPSEKPVRTSEKIGSMCLPSDTSYRGKNRSFSAKLVVLAFHAKNSLELHEVLLKARTSRPAFHPYFQIQIGVAI